MLKKSRLSQAIMLAFGGGLLAGAIPALAQDTQRVEITGSSIKRVESEGALPVQVLKKEDIAKTGATNISDLLQKLPAMQNSTNEGSAVGGETFGFGGVSIHNLTENRTLVLLNGHRISKFAGQTVTGSANAIDLNTLPLSAIERIEILTDGASALYGADAVAGVINFITIKGSTEGNVSVGLSYPTLGGARETRISLSKGFGNFDQDGFNAVFALSYDKRGTLAATERSFAKTGLVSISDYQGQLLGANTGVATSKRSIPANLNLYDATGDQVVRLNPALTANGVCPPFHVKSGLSCRYDFTSQLEIFPDRERMNGFASVEKKLGEGLKWTAELLVSQTKSTSRIAPPPGELPLQVGTAAYRNALNLAKQNGYYPIGVNPGPNDPALVGNFDPTTMDANLRFTELGKRTNVNKINLIHFVTGLEGTTGAWDYSGSFTHSENVAKDTFGGGYATVSGVAGSTFLGFDPLLGLGQQSAAGQAAINSAKLSGYWNGGKSVLDSLNFQISREVGRLEGGPIQLGLGSVYQRERLNARPGDILAGRISYQTDVNNQPCAASGLPCVGTAIDQRFGDSGINPPYTARRTSYGAFAELVTPFTKQLEVTSSLRIDRTNDFGRTINGKLALRFQPSKELLVRASLGSGYLAPSIAQVNAPVQNYGVTSNAYDCSGDPASLALQALADAKGVTCDAGAQFQQFAVGNKQLRPEKSKQFTFGAIWEPSKSLALGADLWSVFIKDSIGQKSEQVVFADPNKYAQYFTTFTDPTTGKKLLAFIFPSENLGNTINTGIDFNFTGRFKVADVNVTSAFTATRLLKSSFQNDRGGPYVSDLANADEQTNVSFRWQGRWTNTFDIGNWSTSAGLNFKSGYLDSSSDAVILANPVAGAAVGDTVKGYRHPVRWFYTLDMVTKYTYDKSLTLTAGVLNLFNRNPPFVFSQGGTGRGQEVGWDGRYYDPRGRTIYVNASYAF